MKCTHAGCFAAGLVVTAIVSAVSPLRAGTVYWNAGSGAGDLSPASVTNIPGTVAFGAFSRGNNQGTEVLNNSTSASSGYSFQLNGTSTNASGAFNFGADTLVGVSLSTATSTYFSVTITPDPGTSFELTSIGFGTRSTTNGPQAWTLRSSLDSFATDLVTPGTLSNNSAWVYVDTTLTTPLVGTAATELRIYGYAVDGPQSFASNTWRIDDVQLQVVPEPSITLLAAAGCGLAAAAFRRRGRHRSRGPTKVA
jgi:hypothetical protein